MTTKLTAQDRRFLDMVKVGWPDSPSADVATVNRDLAEREAIKLNRSLARWQVLAGFLGGCIIALVWMLAEMVTR